MRAIFIFFCGEGVRCSRELVNVAHMLVEKQTEHISKCLEELFSQPFFGLSLEMCFVD